MDEGLGRVSFSSTESPTHRRYEDPVDVLRCARFYFLEIEVLRAERSLFRSRFCLDRMEYFLMDSNHPFRITSPFDLRF